MATVTEADDIVAGMKRSALAAEYHRRLVGMIPADLFADPAAPVFAHTVATSSMNLAAMAAARQGFDSGRYGAVTDCPYLGTTDNRHTFLRRAWNIGYAAGIEVTPRPAPRRLDHMPVVITA